MRCFHLVACLVLAAIFTAVLGCGGSEPTGPEPSMDVKMENEFEQGSKTIDPDNV